MNKRFLNSCFVGACLMLLGLSKVVSAQTCNANIPAYTPAEHFTVNGDGTVTHNKTNLMWKVCAEGQSWSADNCAGNASTYNWSNALTVPDTVNTGGGYAGYTDWRLPNVKELASIAELKCEGPAVNETIFPATPANNFWSATPDVENDEKVRSIYFGDGGNISNDREGVDTRVRLVRGG